MDIGEQNLSSNAYWSEYATTVAGSWSGQPGVAPNRLQSPQGLAIASNDLLFIADTDNERIVVIGPNSTTALAILSAENLSLPIDSFAPTDVVISHEHLYVLNLQNAEILKWRLNISDPLLIQGNPTIIANVAANRYLFVDKNGDLYSTNGERSAVIRLLPNATDFNEGVIVAGTPIRGTSPKELNQASGLYVDEYGSLYVADADNHRIQKWLHGANSGVTVAGNGRCNGSGLNQLCTPYSLTLDVNQVIYTIERRYDRIVRWIPFAEYGQCIAACSGSSGLQANRLFGPLDFVFDRQGSLYVSDFVNMRVQKFQILFNYGKCYVSVIDSPSIF